MKMLNMLLLAFTVISTMASGVEVFEFLKEEGDIASSQGWGGTLPSSNDVVKFSTSGTYTASDDVEFAAMTVTAKNVTFDFRVQDGEPRSLKVTRLEAYKPGQKLKFNGGVIDIQDGLLLQCAKGKNREGGGQLMEFSDGAVVTNVGEFRISYRDTNNTFRLSDGSKMYVDSVYWDYGEGISNAVEILSGSEMVVYSYLRDSYFKNPTKGYRTMSKILVSGDGSRLSLMYTNPVSDWESLSLGSVYAGGELTVSDCAIITNTSQMVMGKGAYGNETKVSVLSGGVFNQASDVLVGNVTGSHGHDIKIAGNGSKMTIAGNLKVSQGYGSCSNRIEITEGGVLDLSKEIYVSSGQNSFANEIVITKKGKLVGSQPIRLVDASTSHDNRVEVRDEGEAYFSLFYLGGYSGNASKGGYNNTLFVSNATFECVRFVFGMAPSAVSNKVFVSGSGSKFKTTYTSSLSLFGLGRCHEMVLDDGAKWSYPQTVYLDENACSNRLVVTRNATLNIARALISGTNTLSHSQYVEVSDGARLEIGDYLYITRSDNAFVVSNATLFATNHIYVGCLTRTVSSDAVSGNSLTVSGTNPVVESRATFAVDYNSVLRIALPETGYEDGIVPISAKKVTFAEGRSRLEIDGIFEMRRCYGRKKSRYTLMSAEDQLTIPDAVVEAVNTSFADAGADDCCVYKDGKRLVLKVPFAKGSIFCIR